MLQGKPVDCDPRRGGVAQAFEAQCSRAAAITRFRAPSLTPAWPLSTRETVGLDTFARRAISPIVTALPRIDRGVAPSWGFMLVRLSQTKARRKRADKRS